MQEVHAGITLFFFSKHRNIGCKFSGVIFTPMSIRAVNKESL